jgi:hypothetical protein
MRGYLAVMKQIDKQVSANSAKADAACNAVSG